VGNELIRRIEEEEGSGSVNESITNESESEREEAIESVNE